MFERDALPRVVPFLAYIAFIVVADVLSRFGWSAQELRWLYPVKIATVLVLLLAYWRRYEELARPRFDARALAWTLVTGIVVLLLWVNLNAEWMTVGSSPGFDPRNNGAIDWGMVVIRIAGAALVVPVMEELFWRSFLMRWLESPRFLSMPASNVKVKSFVITVILFGLEHNLWLAGMVAGAAYGVLYMRTQSLWAPIVAHGVTNGLLGVWVVFTANWTYW